MSKLPSQLLGRRQSSGDAGSSFQCSVQDSPAASVRCRSSWREREPSRLEAGGAAGEQIGQRLWRTRYASRRGGSVSWKSGRCGWRHCPEEEPSSQGGVVSKGHVWNLETRRVVQSRDSGRRQPGFKSLLYDPQSLWPWTRYPSSVKWRC